MLAGPISLVFYAELKIKDEVVDRSNGEQYRSAVEKATTLEELYDLIIEVNENNKKWFYQELQYRQKYSWIRRNPS